MHSKTKRYLVISSMIFALFFGAGNLIFPLHLGQIAGHNWFTAAIGFIVTGVLLPLLAILAIVVTHSKGVYGLGSPLGAKFAIFFMVLIQMTIGPVFGTPRTATVSFAVGVAPFIPAHYQQLALGIFTAIFFLTAYLIAYNESDILDSLGKVLNPIFLILLFLVFVVAFMFPLGNPSTAPTTAQYTTIGNSFLSGFLEGYNTMDALAALCFGITIITSIKQMGIKSDKEIALTTAKSGTMGMMTIAIIYLLLIVLGAMSLGKFKVAPDGGVAFSQVVQSYAGMIGQAILATMMTVTCLTTAVGLVSAFALDFNRHFPKVSYHRWLLVSCLGSFIVGNFGLDALIKWSIPVLMFLYPVSMAIIVLSLLSPLFKKDKMVYWIAMIFTMIPALLDFIVNLPPAISNTAFGNAAKSIRSSLPLANLGLTWLLPLIIGLVLGMTIYKLIKLNNQS